MIPASNTLTTLIGRDRRQPIVRVTVFDTNKTVPSKGFNVAFYGLSAAHDMANDWWTAGQGMLSTYPANSQALGTFIAGDNIIEPATALAFDWGVAGVPAPVSDRIDLWAARWYGKFFARFGGVYTFYIDSSFFSRVRIKFDGSYLNLLNPDSVATERWGASAIDTQKEMSADTAALTKGTWYDIQIEMHIPKMLDPSEMPTYMVVKYKEPNATTNLDLWGASGGDIVTNYPSDSTVKKPLSAGVVNTVGAFESGIEITDISSLSGTMREGEVSEYQFVVNLPAGTNLDGLTTGGEGILPVDSTDGFPTTGAILISGDIVTYTGIDINPIRFKGCSGVGTYADNALVSAFAGLGGLAFNPLTGEIGDLKSYRLIRIEGGLFDAAVDNYTDRMWGNIYPSPEIDRSNKTATIRVRDFGWRMARKYNRNFPDNSSYSMADYYIARTSAKPDGATRPPAYDRWDIGKALRDIIIQSGIDPVLLYQRERVAVTALFESSYGAKLVAEGINLDSKLNYGRPMSIEGESPDDKYLWSIGYGEYLFETISEIIRSFAYKYAVTRNGYIKAKPYGLPDSEYIVDDAALTKVGAGWVDTDEVQNFRGMYTASPTPGDKITMATEYFEDFELVMFRHAGASQKIKIKVGASYLLHILVDGIHVEGTGGGGDEFDITRAAGDWKFYDGVDPSLGVNPSIIRLVDPVAFANAPIEVEVVSGTPRFNALRLFKRSTRSTVVSIGNEEMGTLTMVDDITNQRNEVDIIGAHRGIEASGEGVIINPDNPVFIHTVARRIDVGSVYDENASNYVGDTLPVEVFDERILDQERANLVAESVLNRYRISAIEGSTTILFDPRLEPADSISLTDQHTKMLLATQAWIGEISEEMTTNSDGVVSYVTTINQALPREPMISTRLEPNPNIADWNNEAIVNVEIKYKGFRVAGKGATSDQASRTVTIASDPQWPVGLWNGYFAVDDHGNQHEIVSNTSNTLLLVGHLFFRPGNWCITFDPLDSEGAGSPIEIHYDQVISGTVTATIVDRYGNEVARLTDRTGDVITKFGSGKVLYWTGIIHEGGMNIIGNFYASKNTLANFDDKMPLGVRFVLRDESGVTTYSLTTMEIGVTNNDPSSEMQFGGHTDSVQNPEGSAKIVPRILDEGYYMEVLAPNNLADGTVFDMGRMRKYTDQGGGVFRLFLDARSDISADSFNGKYVISGKSGVSFLITDSGNDGTDGWLEVSGITVSQLTYEGFDGTHHTGNIATGQSRRANLTDLGFYPMLIISNTQGYPYVFKQSENSGRGLELTFRRVPFWVDGLSADMFIADPAGGADRVINTQTDDSGERPSRFGFNNDHRLSALDKLTCQLAITIHHESSTYVVPAGSDIWQGDIGSAPVSAQNADGTGRYVMDSMTIYWSKDNPTYLYWTPGAPPDLIPSLGLFAIARITAIPATLGVKVAIVVPSRDSSARTFVMQPDLEIHQLWRVDATDGTARYEDGFVTAETGLGRSSFLPAVDHGLVIDPSNLRTEEEDIPLNIENALDGLAIPDSVLWAFVIKTRFYDRAGRPPLNMPNSHENDTEDGGESFTKDDWDAVIAFWIPETLTLADASNQWWIHFFFFYRLNIKIAAPVLRYEV